MNNQPLSRIQQGRRPLEHQSWTYLFSGYSDGLPHCKNSPNAFICPLTKREMAPQLLLRIITAKPRHGHAVFTLWLYQCTSSVQLFLLTQNQSPKDMVGSNFTAYSHTSVHLSMPMFETTYTARQQ